MGTTIFVILSVLKFFFIPPLSLEMKSELKIIPTTTSYLTLLESGHIFWGVVYIPSIRISCITKKSQLSVANLKFCEKKIGLDGVGGFFWRGLPLCTSSEKNESDEFLYSFVTLDGRGKEP